MTWSGFKKGVKRAGIQLLQRTGRIEKTVDHSFESKQRSLKRYEAQVNNLFKGCKKYLDATRAFTSAQHTIAECFELICTESKGLGITKYRDEMAKIEEETRPEFDLLYKQVALTPITKFSFYFPKINGLVTKRAHKLLDYDASKSKLKRELEKKEKNESKLNQLETKCEERKQIYDKYNRILVEGIPIMFGMRRDYFLPSFEFLFKAQLYFYDEMAYGIDKMRKELSTNQETNSTEVCTNEMKINNSLNEIKQLSITLST